jgi:hypothetical protein
VIYIEIQQNMTTPVECCLQPCVKITYKCTFSFKEYRFLLIYPRPLRNLKMKKVVFSWAKLDKIPQRALTNIATMRVFLRPKASPRLPQKYPPISIPINIMADNQPLSLDDNFRSHVAEGRTNEMQRISMASLALAQPQTNKSQ